ncbi:hypothetical protein jhhlp_005209 [Lomentospora prolificans]|uniref:Protein kinase domain-containing protein n=1 Tax=Lomentospora prolificans TaxID=41688 RepID=A0A2N3N758_9PEZI|nr:hypothetical protein jhhlp_005209 [Lomentospora prolificans]
MGERILDSSEACSQEKTEPFSQSEIDARLKKKNLDIVDWFDDLEASPIHLDLLKVEDHHHDAGIRLLVRPLVRTPSVSPGNENCQWQRFLSDTESQDQQHHKALAVTQTAKDVKFQVRIPGENTGLDSRPPLWCELYYHPSSDAQILYNRSDIPITLTRESNPPADDEVSHHEVNPGTTRALAPGTWRIHINDLEVLDFRILKKRPALVHMPKFNPGAEQVSPPKEVLVFNSSGKRPSTDDVDDSSRNDKKARTGDASDKTKDGVLVCVPVRPASGELVRSNGQALVGLEKGETVHIPGTSDLAPYQVTKLDQIASAVASTVYTANCSHVPNQVVTVKVLKTRSAGGNVKPHDAERSVIHQADMWLREYQSQDALQHGSIVKLYGGDARHLALYMEHVDSRDLSARGVWRNQANDHFIGGKADAQRILRDIASALHYIHGRNLLHNDIKPSNILYSSEQGATLCDFGLSTYTREAPAMGGTPYYVPPEFIGRKLRGPASDIWALGITMLYVLRKIPLPESRGGRAHPKRLWWLIADLNRGGGNRMQQSITAVTQMQMWLGEIAEARSRLNPRDKMEKLVSEMLVPNPRQRISVAEVLDAMFSDEPASVANNQAVART